MIESHVTIANAAGLHLRAATHLVTVAQSFLSEVFLHAGEIEANGKSILSVLMLGLPQGARARLQVYGDDETEAHESLCRLFEGGFGEA